LLSRVEESIYSMTPPYQATITPLRYRKLVGDPMMGQSKVISQCTWYKINQLKLSSPSYGGFKNLLVGSLFGGKASDAERPLSCVIRVLVNHHRRYHAGYRIPL